jgi:CRISPR-associated protein Csc2
MSNYLLGIVLADGEIFSNLKLTQRLYDILHANGGLRPPDPVDIQQALSAARSLVPELLREDGVVVEHFVDGADLEALLSELRAADSNQTQQFLRAAFDDSQVYHDRWIAKSKKR